MPTKKNAKKKAKSSPNFPLLARGVVEASRDEAACKLPKGLYVVATPLGNLGDITLRALTTLAAVDSVACEDLRMGGSLLAHYGIKKPLVRYDDHSADKARPTLLHKLEKGEAVALISDAGMPLIADPGFKLVRACKDAGHPVTVIPGANAALMALTGAGLPTDAFYFAGFLPPKTNARLKAIEKLLPIPATLLIYEAPQRLSETLTDLEKILGAARPAAVARELSKLFEETRVANLGELAAFYRDTAVKGEIVIVVAPPETKVLVSDISDFDDLIRDSLRLHSLRDAVASVSAATGARKGEIYARALWLRGKGLT